MTGILLLIIIICNTDMINITRILQNHKGTNEQANKAFEAAKH